MSFFINPYRFGVAYDADYQAWLDRLTTLGYTHPSAACNQILSDMVAGIKSDGNWTSLDRFWFFAHNGDSDGATVDMVTPTNQATKVNSPGWTAKQGFNSNGTTSHLSSNFLQTPLFIIHKIAHHLVCGCIQVVMQEEQHQWDCSVQETLLGLLT